MIRLAIGELYSKVYIIPIENISNNNLWIPHILSLVPPFDVVYANNKLVELLFKFHNFRVENILWQKIDGIKISSRMIRRLIVEEKNWKLYVPEQVAEYVEKINGVERIKILEKTSVFECLSRANLRFLLQLLSLLLF